MVWVQKLQSQEVVLAAVQSDPMALQHASLAMQDDDEVVFLSCNIVCCRLFKVLQSGG